MKQTTKGESPAAFEAWKAQQNENWVPEYGLLQNPEKQILHTALLAEQGYLCCYCGRQIFIDDSHIEHFRPQRQFPQESLDYSNLHASCIRQSRPQAPLHCGHAKGEKYDQALAISPQDPECESRFVYTWVGGVRPAQGVDESARYMIDLLALDCPFLRNRREEALRRTFDLEFLATASTDELFRLAEGFRAPIAGRMAEFCHVIARFAEQQISANSGVSRA